MVLVDKEAFIVIYPLVIPYFKANFCDQKLCSGDYES